MPQKKVNIREIKKSIVLESTMGGPGGVFKIRLDPMPTKIDIMLRARLITIICFMDVAIFCALAAGVTMSAVTRIMPTNLIPSAIVEAKSIKNISSYFFTGMPWVVASSGLRVIRVSCLPVSSRVIPAIQRIVMLAMMS